MDLLKGDPFHQLPALAERLGVKPLGDGDKSYVTVMLTTKDGQRYDLFELINALLDRIDKAV